METITDINQLDPDATYTYADYMLWRFEEYVELFRGKLRRMSPAPLRYHQRIVLRISSSVEHFLRRKPCDVYIAPFDVRLPKKKSDAEDRQIYTVVQPDICIVCDRSKLDRRGCIGAPDTIIEVLSQGNAGRDLKEKYALYEEHGVPEYWIVLPAEKLVLVYLLKEDAYVPAGEFGEPGEIPVHSLPGFSLIWEDIFGE